MIVCKPLNGRSRDNSASPSRYLLTGQQVANHTVPTGHRPYREAGPNVWTAAAPVARHLLLRRLS
jgi:hypothetical protein